MKPEQTVLYHALNKLLGEEEKAVMGTEHSTLESGMPIKVTANPSDNPRVLLADDNPTTRLVLRKNLTDWGYRVVEAVDGYEAWSVLSGEDAPRLAILDWMMPGLDGVTLCSRVVRQRRRGYIYTILLTTRNCKQDILNGFAAGADDYLIKPVDVDELRSRLHAGARVAHYEEQLRNKEFGVRLECYRALTELAEMRDDETGAHLKRLGTYAGRLAQEAGMVRTFIDNISRFAPMHDIGKVGIPDDILLAPRNLTPQEYEVMKTHSTLGWQILKGKPTLEMAADIAYTHHERYDGTGYPRGLRGDKIPLSGRIVAIADVYDALRSERPYKNCWSQEETVAHIRGLRGSHFDPALVDVFEHLQDELAAVFAETQDKPSSAEESPEGRPYQERSIRDELACAAPGEDKDAQELSR